MPLTIRDPQIERLAAEVAGLAGESEADAVRHALEERRDRLTPRPTGPERASRLRQYLTHELWPSIPSWAREAPVTAAESDAILGYGEHGV